MLALVQANLGVPSARFSAHKARELDGLEELYCREAPCRCAEAYNDFLEEYT